MKRVLITGGSGFIGSHVIEHLLRMTDWNIITMDRLGVSGNYHRIRDMQCWEEEGYRVSLVHHDLRSPVNEMLEKKIGQVDYILHLAASTHVDRSIEDPMGFVLDNVVATTNMLMFARKQTALKAFLYFSTDEVFGAAPVGTNYREWDRYNSGNPYSAAKAGGEEMALAFANTYGIPVIITHTMNAYGERQHPEKFIPMCIKKILNDEEVIIHSYPNLQKAASRFWIHSRNIADALVFLLNGGADKDHLPRPTYWRTKNADKFNIVGEREVDVLEMAQTIARILGKELKYKMVDTHSSRPGHDVRYALSGEKMKALGWVPPVNFEDSLRRTVEWTIANPEWLQ